MKIIILIATIILWILWKILYTFLCTREKDEKQLTGNKSFTAKVTKRLLVFYAICTIIMTGAVIAIPIIHLLRPSVEPVLPFIEAFLALGLLAYAVMSLYRARSHYYIISEDQIIQVRAKKQTVIPFDGIAYITKLTKKSDPLVAYDANGILLFCMDNTHIGQKTLAEILENRNIPYANEPFPTEALKQTPEYKRHKKITSAKEHAWCFFVIGLLLLLLTGLILGINTYEPFANTKIHGTVATVQAETDTVTITLSGDENTYLINNLVYEILDTQLLDVLKKGTEVTIYVGYVDMYDRSNVSQIEIDDTVYLDKEEAQAHERDNYEGLAIIAYACLAIGVILLLCGICTVYWLRKNKNETKSL